VCWGERSDEVGACVRSGAEGDKRSSRGGMDDAVVGGSMQGGRKKLHLACVSNLSRREILMRI